MAKKVCKRDNRFLAKLVIEDKAPCAFCHREVDDEVTYGKLYAIGDIQCHYFCVLLSCCLVQKGPEEDGLFGFMYKDILIELERSKKHKCSYCGRGGANLGCSVGACRKQFHLPCGRERNAVSLFYGSYKSFCQVHAPKQRLPEHIMFKAKLRMREGRKAKCSTDLISTENGNKCFTEIVKTGNDADQHEEDMVCVICYEAVDAFPTVNTFWPPCCARDAWFHRSCLQRMALSAGMHYLKCPLCNDKANFYDAVINQGYYVPDRDAAWELEQNAFAEIYERPLTCTAEECHCPLGRKHDDDQGKWDIKLCLLCGSVGAHTHCIGANETTRYVCLTCTPAAPEDIQTLADTIEKMILQEQVNSVNTVRQGPVMPSRMSLRRTKGLAVSNRPSSSGSHNIKTHSESTAEPNIQSSRQDLNLRTPRRNTYRSIESPNKVQQTEKNIETNLLTPRKQNESYFSPRKQSVSCKNLEAKFVSPMKLLEQSFKEKLVCMGVKDAVLGESAVDILRKRFIKPRPWCEKKKIVECSADVDRENSDLNRNTMAPELSINDFINDILDGLFQNLSNSLKQKDPVREWCSPRKCHDATNDESQTSKNAPNYTEKIVENKENGTENTPRKFNSANLTISTPNEIVDTPKITKIKDFNNEVKNIKDKSNDIEENDKNDDSSNSTFQLPSEFVAETLCGNSFLGFETPKRKTIDMKQSSSLEISEQDQTINIDIMKIEDTKEKTPKKKCAFKFSPLDKEKLEETNVGIDLERFKKEYLNEVDSSGYKCNFNHNHDHSKALNKVKFRSVIDFAIDAHNKIKCKTKRRVSEAGLILSNDVNPAKKRKMSDNGLDLSFSNSSDDFEIKKEFKTTDTENQIKGIDLTLSNRIKDKKRDDNERKDNKSKVKRNSIKKSNLKDKLSKTKKRSNIKYKNLKNDENFPKYKTNEAKLEKNSKLNNKRKSLNESVVKKDEMPDDSKLTDKELDKKLGEEKFVKITKSDSDVNNKQLCKQEKDTNSDKSRELTQDEEKQTNDIKKTEKRHRLSKGRINKDKLKQHKRMTDNRRKKEKRLKARKSDEKSEKRKEKYKQKKSGKHTKDIEVTIDSFKSNSKKKTKTKFSISNEKDISVKIKWKKKQLRLKIESKKAKLQKIEKDTKFKQYVLQYFSEITPKQVLVKPEKEVSPPKRKYVKQEKTPDKFRQMSIQNFFKVKSPE